MYDAILMNKIDFQTTDLDSVGVQFKVNNRLIQFSGSSDNESAVWPSEEWDAVAEVPVLFGLKPHDDLSVIFTDSGGGQAIEVTMIGTLLPPKQTT